MPEQKRLHESDGGRDMKEYTRRWINCSADTPCFYSFIYFSLWHSDMTLLFFPVCQPFFFLSVFMEFALVFCEFKEHYRMS